MSAPMGSQQAFALRVGASAVLGFMACCSPPPTNPGAASVSAKPMLNVASADVTSTPIEEAAPATFDEVATLLVRSRAESEDTRKKTLTVARRALVTLTGTAGKPVVIAKVRSPRGHEETWLLPQGAPVELAEWPKKELRIAGNQVRVVGDKIVSTRDGQVALWSDGRKQVAADTSAELITVPGDPRFVLVRGRDNAFVLDTQDGSSRLAGPSLGAVLVRAKDGTRFLRREDTGARRYARFDLPELTEKESWSFYLGTNVSGRHVAVGRLDDKGAVTVSVLALPDLTVQSSATLATLPNGAPRAFEAGLLNGEGTAFASVEPGDGVRLLRMPTGKEEVIARESKGRPVRSLAFTEDGNHVCADAPGAPIPRAKLVPGTFQRCYPTARGALIGHVGEPPIGWRRANHDEISGATGATFEAISRDGSRIASTLFQGSLSSSPQVAVAVHDAKTGKQLWNQFIDQRDLRVPSDLWFSDDGLHLKVGPVRVMAENGEAVDGKPVDLATLEPLLGGFGVNLGSGPMVAAHLAGPIPSFPSPPLVLSASPTGLTVYVDPTSGVAAIQSQENRKVAVFAPASEGAVAYLPDGSFAMTGTGDDLACQFGSVLAPIEVCRSSGEASAADVGTILRNVF